MPNKPNKRDNLLDVEPSDSDSSSTDWERGVLPDLFGRPRARYEGNDRSTVQYGG